MRKLLFGPYETPRFRYSATVHCEVRGEVEIVGESDGRIPWPLGRPKGARGTPSLIVYKGLAEAVRREANVAVQYWWGVAPSTVSKWRVALGVPRSNEGTNRLFVAKNRTPQMERARQKAYAKARDPQRRAKIAAARLGKRRPKHVMEALHRANVGRKHTEETRKAMSQVHRKRGTRPPWLNDPWTPKEDALLAKLPAADVAKRTGRSLSAVYARRRQLGLPDGRRRKHKTQ